MIKTLIIMTTYGQIFYSKEAFFDAKVGETDISLTAGLISAIYNMTAETQQQKITELELEADRSVFKELPGEKLFIITVDKRMDNDDADDMLDDLSNKFVDQYGDRVMDGMILNDFEPTVDEVVADRLWYSTTDKSPKFTDLIPLIAIFFSAFWYPYWLIEGQTTIIDPLKEALESGVIDLLIQSIFIGLLTVGPLIITLLILRKFPNMALPFRFAFEFLRRPTRGGYAELLPWWFLTLPFSVVIATISTIVYSRGMQYALTIQVFPPFLDENVTGWLAVNNFFLFIVLVYLFFYFATWFILLPTIVGVLVGDLSWRWYKSSAIVSGISLIAFIPAHLFAGFKYHEWLGYNPANEALFGNESQSLAYFFEVNILANLVLFLFIFFIGVGMSQLIKTNRERYPIAFGLALFIVITVQNIIFFMLFKSTDFGFVNVFGPQ